MHTEHPVQYKSCIYYVKIKIHAHVSIPSQSFIIFICKVFLESILMSRKKCFCLLVLYLLRPKQKNPHKSNFFKAFPWDLKKKEMEEIAVMHKMLLFLALICLMIIIPVRLYRYQGFEIAKNWSPNHKCHLLLHLFWNKTRIPHVIKHWNITYQILLNKTWFALRKNDYAILFLQ